MPEPTNDKPTTAKAAVEAAAAASGASGQADSSPAVSEPSQPTSTPADATSQSVSPEAGGGEGSAPVEGGPIPLERHKAILEKARAEAEQIRQRYAWAESLNQDEVSRALGIFQDLNTDPLSFRERLQRELEAHPHLGPQLREPKQFEMPKPALLSQDGHGVWSAEQVQSIIEHANATAEARVARAEQQLLARLEGLEQRDRERVRYAEADRFSQAMVTELGQLPKFKDLESAIAKDFAAAPAAQTSTPGDARATLLSLYLKHYQSKVASDAKTQVLSEAGKKVAAGTVDPSAGAASSVQRPTNRKELVKFLKERAGAA